MIKEKRVAVIGLGYVGLPLALLAEKKGWEVVGIDVDEDKIKKLNQRVSPMADEAIAADLSQSAFQVTSDFSELSDASIIVICVPTPVFENRLPNLGPVESACQALSPHLKAGQTVILESTVNPGITEGVVQPILEKNSGLKAGHDFFLSHCPERINPGDRQWSVANIPRVVGSLGAEGLKRTVDFYKSVIAAEVRPMGSIKEAEAVKVVENSFRDVNIAFVNELAQSFSMLGIDVVNVINGASTKPFSFMPHYPGCGVGGHCIPVDPYYLIEHAKKNGFEHDFLSLARRINNQMPHFVVELLINSLNKKKIAINGAKVAVLGLAYKSDIDDTRESPAFEVIKHLKMHGADVVTYDPFVLDQSSVKSLEEALTGAKAVVVTTAHQVFRQLTPQTLADYGVETIIDGRNCLPKEDFVSYGINYQGVGR